MTALADQGAALLGGRLKRTVPLTGGDLSHIIRIELEDRRQAIVKGGAFAVEEADMLRAIKASGAPAPEVLAVSDSVLVLEVMPSNGSLQDAWANLGRALGALHRQKGASYGWPRNYAFGAVVIPNGWLSDWPTFWAERRLLIHAPHVPPGLGRRLENLASDLPNRLPAKPSPSLLHGDLWGGNVLISGNEVSALIDPACYYGHGEVDIAMLSLFDRPASAFYMAYGALEPGWEGRLILYKLWPALVHLRLFGGGYRGLVETLLVIAGV